MSLNTRKSINIMGTVAKIEFINPHSYLTINVKDAQELKMADGR
jgi:hypothetical protein